MELFKQIGLAMAVLGGLGAFFGLVLAVANRVFYVQTDPRLEPLTQALPGANCGGCGFSGCGAYAQAVLDGKAPVGLCASGGDAAAQSMAAIMGFRSPARWRLSTAPGKLPVTRASMREFTTAWPPPRWQGAAL